MNYCNYKRNVLLTIIVQHFIDRNTFKVHIHVCKVKGSEYMNFYGM